MDRQFPPEIIQLIVKASIGPATTPSRSAQTSTRYSTLLSYSTLNSTWNEISRRFLYKYVTIDDRSDAKLLIEACGTNEETKYLVRTLTVSGELSKGGNYWHADRIVQRALECVPRVRTLVVRHNKVRFSDLAPLQNLRRLYLTAVAFEPPSSESPISSTASLPSLTHLDCFNCDLRAVSDSFFHPQFLPQIRSIAYRESPGRLDNFEGLGPQLKAIKVRTEDACAATLPHAKSLLLLSLSSSVYLSTAVDNFTTTPRFLHFDHADSPATRESLEFLVNSRKTGLEVIFLDAKEASCGWAREWQPCVDALRAKGIRVELGELSFLKAIERMDKIMKEAILCGV